MFLIEFLRLWFKTADEHSGISQISFNIINKSNNTIAANGSVPVNTSNVVSMLTCLLQLFHQSTETTQGSIILLKKYGPLANFKTLLI